MVLNSLLFAAGSTSYVEGLVETAALVAVHSQVVSTIHSDLSVFRKRRKFLTLIYWTNISRSNLNRIYMFAWLNFVFGAVIKSYLANKVIITVV